MFTGRYDFSILSFTLALIYSRAVAQHNDFSTSTTVGQLGANVHSTPVNQLLTPTGRQLELPGMRPQAMALSPSGRLLAVSGRTHELLLIDPFTASISQRVPLPAQHEPGPQPTSTHILQPDPEAQLSFTGLIFSPDGARIFLSDVRGTIKVFAVDANDRVSGLNSFSLPPANVPERKEEIPAGLCCSADGRKLYVALNLANRLLEMDAAQGSVLRTWDVGVAPFDVKIAATKAYVSNWGGRRPAKGDLTGPA